MGITQCFKGTSMLFKFQKHGCHQLCPFKKESYAGTVEEFVAPVSGKWKYTMECWGAQGSNIQGKIGGKGGYCEGTVELPQRTLYVCVGAQSGGFGGGGVSSGAAQRRYGVDGGGATDVRLEYQGNYRDFSSLKSRIIVAAGGGGANHRNTAGESPQWGQGDGGYGGGLTGGDGVRDDNTITFGTVPFLQKSFGATQTSGGTAMIINKSSNGTFSEENGKINPPHTGCFGYAVSGTDSQIVQAGSIVQSGGGGGYYGGATCTNCGASGGSSFISGYEDCDAISENSTESKIVHTGKSKHYSEYVFTDATMIAGNANMPLPTGETGTREVGHSGNGACIITWIAW